jgi:hypothetical protein
VKRILTLLGIGLLLAGCGGGSASDQPTPTSGLEGQIVATEVLVGHGVRFPVGILEHNTPVNDAHVHIRTFFLGTNGAESKGEADAQFRGDGLQGAGVYVAHLDFDTAGSWGAEITASRPTGAHGVIRLSFNVLAQSVVPAPGQPAPRSHNPTVADAPDASYIDSGNPPDDMHQVSIADAIGQHKPTLVVFASPAFCTSRICGPEVQVVQSLEPNYRDRLTFIHVEIYTNFKPDPAKKQLAQTVLDWRLQTEPWIFLIGKDGVIRDRFEGPTAVDEVRDGIDHLLAG